MRLIGAVKRLEGAAADAAAEVVGGSVGIAWTLEDRRIDAMSLEEGEYIAVDITRRDAGDGTTWWSVAERPTCDVADLGRFYTVADVPGAEAVVAGRVVAIDTDMLRFELFDSPGLTREYLRLPDPDADYR